MIKNQSQAGRYGDFGGQYVPETLMTELQRLDRAFQHYRQDAQFQEELSDLLNNYANRPSLLYHAQRIRSIRWCSDLF